MSKRLTLNPVALFLALVGATVVAHGLLFMGEYQTRPSPKEQ
jgi:hypothetical protein